MLDIINNAPELCDNSTSCIAEWNKLRKHYETQQYTSALTHLGGLSGAVPINNDTNIYGSQFMPVEIKTPAYERHITVDTEVPWIPNAVWLERTFLNRTKALNERPVGTYQYIKNSSIPQIKYEPVEHFGLKTTENFTFKILALLFLALIIFLITFS